MPPEALDACLENTDRLVLFLETAAYIEMSRCRQNMIQRVLNAKTGPLFAACTGAVHSGQFRKGDIMKAITACLWFDGKAAEAAAFYTSLLPDSRVLRARLATC